MPIPVYGVTPQSVRQHWFPQRAEFSAGSNPTAAAVTTMVSWAGAEVSAWLLKEAVVATTVNAQPDSVAYAKCADIVRVLTAQRVLFASTGDDPALAKRLAAEVESWRKGLDTDGATFLGDESLSTSSSNPNGPTTHISAYGLDTGNPDDASDVVPRLRRKDEL